jgi:hypothetical protein
MLFRKLIYSVLILATFFLFSQFQCYDEGCFDPNNPVRIIYHNFNYTIFALNNQGPTPVVAADNKAPFHAFGLRIQHNTLWVDSLSVLSEECTVHLPDTAITQIFVSSLQKFDGTNAAGATLNDYFRVRLNKETWDLPAYLTLDQGMAPFNTIAHTSHVDIVLVTPPAQSGVYQFKVALVRSSLDTIFLVTKPITLYN